MNSVTPLNLHPSTNSPRVFHPLEPLTAHEVQTAVDLLKSAGKVTPTTRFVSVSLAEPSKAEVHSGARGAGLRNAFIVLFDNLTNTVTKRLFHSPKSESPHGSTCRVYSPR